MVFDPTVHHRRSIRLKNYDYSRPGYYFITIVVRGRRCVLGEIQDGSAVLNPVGGMVRDVWLGLPSHFPGVELDVFIVMPNHVHGIVVLTGRDPNVGAGLSARPPGHPQRGAPTVSLHSVIHGFKSWSTQRYFQIMKYKAPSNLWQRNYYEHVIRCEESLAAVRNYMCHNPLEWNQDPENPGGEENDC